MPLTLVLWRLLFFVIALDYSVMCGFIFLVFHIAINHIWKIKQILMQVLEWMEDGGIHPTNEMYHDISSFSQKCCGAENVAVIKERLGMDILLLY